MYPPPLTAFPPSGHGYPTISYPPPENAAPPPPVGYPVKDGYWDTKQPVPVETKSRGGGWFSKRKKSKKSKESKLSKKSTCGWAVARWYGIQTFYSNKE